MDPDLNEVTVSAPYTQHDIAPNTTATPPRLCADVATGRCLFLPKAPQTSYLSIVQDLPPELNKDQYVEVSPYGRMGEAKFHVLCALERGFPVKLAKLPEPSQLTELLKKLKPAA